MSDVLALPSETLRVFRKAVIHEHAYAVAVHDAEDSHPTHGMNGLSDGGF
jgi:hypothetical protein